MTEARDLAGRTATKIVSRDDRLYLTFLDRSGTDAVELRLFLDGGFEVDPEPPGADAADLELTAYLRLGEIPGVTVEDSGVGPEGELVLDFIGGIQLTALRGWELTENMNKRHTSGGA